MELEPEKGVFEFVSCQWVIDPCSFFSICAGAHSSLAVGFLKILYVDPEADVL